MSNIPSITGRDAVKAFERLGFVVVRITGSHHIMKKVGVPGLVSVPVHKGQNLKTGLVKGLINRSGATVEEFIAALR